jgi:hypothetical protein
MRERERGKEEAASSTPHASSKVDMHARTLTLGRGVPT